MNTKNKNQRNTKPKKTKLFTEYGKVRVVDKAGNEDPQYFIRLAKAEKRKKKANAKGISTK